MNEPLSRTIGRGAGAETAPLASDGELIVAVAARSRAAFDELYDRYARAVLGLAQRRVSDHGRAEDVVQDTFAAIWRSAASFRPDVGPGAPWVFAIARNEIANQWRRRTDVPTVLPDAPSTDLGPDDNAELAWRSFCVHRSLESLPAQQRTVIELAYWQGLSQTEISEKLGMPLGTVKTRTRAGLARLAEALREDLQ